MIRALTPQGPDVPFLFSRRATACRGRLGSPCQGNCQNSSRHPGGVSLQGHTKMLRNQWDGKTVTCGVSSRTALKMPEGSPDVLHNKIGIPQSPRSAKLTLHGSLGMTATLTPRSYILTPKNNKNRPMAGFCYSSIYSSGSMAMPSLNTSRCRCGSSAHSSSVVSPTAPITSPATTSCPTVTVGTTARLL